MEIWTCCKFLNVLLHLYRQASIARRDTLLTLFEMLPDLRSDIAVKLLRCVKLLTRDPSMLLPLYVRTLSSSSCAYPCDIYTVRRC